MLGPLVIMLLQIFSWFWKWKNFENRLIYDKVNGFNKNCANFGGHPVDYKFTVTQYRTVVGEKLQSTRWLWLFYLSKSGLSGYNFIYFLLWCFPFLLADVLMLQCCVRLSPSLSVRNVLWLNGASYSKRYYWQPMQEVWQIWEINWYQNEWPSATMVHMTLNDLLTKVIDLCLEVVPGHVNHCGISPKLFELDTSNSALYGECRAGAQKISLKVDQTFSSMGNVTLSWSTLFSVGAQVQTAEDFRGRVKVNGLNSVRESAILISTQFN